MYKLDFTPQAQFTASPAKYPQKRFNPKPCKQCAKQFTPQAPSHLHCSDLCADRGKSDRYLQRTYQISLEEYEDILTQQGGACRICREEGFVMDPNRHRAKLVVDHCHTSGAVRGLLCHNCNRALGLLKDDPERLLRAVEYLERATTIREE